MKILNFLKQLLFMFWMPIAVIVIGIIVGLITNNGLAGFFTTGGLIVALALRGFIVDLIARIKKTGVYEEKDKEE